MTSSSDVEFDLSFFSRYFMTLSNLFQVQPAVNDLSTSNGLIWTRCNISFLELLYIFLYLTSYWRQNWLETFSHVFYDTPQSISNPTSPHWPFYLLWFGLDAMQRKVHFCAVSRCICVCVSGKKSENQNIWPFISPRSFELRRPNFKHINFVLSNCFIPSFK